MRKNNGPKTDSCGIPAKSFFHEDVYSFKSARCCPYVCNLKIKPSCHTLAKAFEMSKNTPLISIDEL